MDFYKTLEILKKYNKEPFHIRHGLTVSLVMKYFAKQNGHNEEYWSMVGLLHDIDYEVCPEEHCVKAVEILKNEGFDDDFINSVCSHGYSLTGTTAKPTHFMEKVLFAVDELTGLIFACVKMRPSKSACDLELSSLKKKFKDKKFAGGCSREVITTGAEILGISLDDLLEQTILAMRYAEDTVNEIMSTIE